MIDPTEKDIGRTVIYEPHPAIEYPDRREKGVVTSFDANYVFVRYGSDDHSKSTHRSRLDWSQPDEAQTSSEIAEVLAKTGMG